MKWRIDVLDKNKPLMELLTPETLTVATEGNELLFSFG